MALQCRFVRVFCCVPFWHTSQTALQCRFVRALSYTLPKQHNSLIPPALIVIASPFEVEKTQPCYHESDYPYEDRAKPSIQEGFFCEISTAQTNRCLCISGTLERKKKHAGILQFQTSDMYTHASSLRCTMPVTHLSRQNAMSYPTIPVIRTPPTNSSPLSI
jgi:hypothetical protein